MTTTDIHERKAQWEQEHGEKAIRVYINPRDGMRLIHEPMNGKWIPAGTWIPKAGGLDWFEDKAVTEGDCRFEGESICEPVADLRY